MLRKCVSKIDNAFVDNTEDLNIVILMYNLLEYRDNYSMISVRRKSNIVNDQQNANYDLGNELTYNTGTLKSNLCVITTMPKF